MNDELRRSMNTVVEMGKDMYYQTNIKDVKLRDLLLTVIKQLEYLLKRL